LSRNLSHFSKPEFYGKSIGLLFLAARLSIVNMRLKNGSKEPALHGRRVERACIDNRFGFREIFNWVDDRRIAVNKKKLSNFSAMKNLVAS
jgi:hypothetical protein